MCIVMRLYKESLQGVMDRSPDGCIPLPDVQRFGTEICKGVAELHEQNIVLQDIKPPNFLVDEYGHCVVADFGISKVPPFASSPSLPHHPGPTSAAAAPIPRTVRVSQCRLPCRVRALSHVRRLQVVHGTLGTHMPCNLQGTFNYMSPESFDPEQFGGVTTRADSWSFACAIIEMVTGKKPWSGEKMATIVRRVMAMEVPQIPVDMLPPQVAVMLSQCFAFNPYQRPTFPQMLSVFLSQWQCAPAPIPAPSFSGPPPRALGSLSARHMPLEGRISTDILEPISHLFDVFRSGPAPAPR